MDTVKSTFFQIIKRKESLLFLVLIIAGITICGWFFANYALTAFSLKYKPISPIIAVTFIVLSILLFININFDKSRLIKSSVTSIFILITLFYSIIILGYIFNFANDIENVLFGNLNRYGNTLTGYMSQIAALEFFCVCISLLLIRKSYSDIIKYIGGSIALLVFLLSSVLLIAYLYNAPLLFGSNIIPIALPAAICFLLFSATLLRIYELKFWTFNLIKDNKVTLQLIKSFLPFAVLTVILQGFLITNFSVKDKNPTLIVAFVLCIVVVLIVFIVIKVSGNLGDKLHRAEQAVRDSEKQFSQFMEYLPALVFIKDSKSKTVYVNKSIDVALGASKWIGLTAPEIFDSETAERILNDDKKTLQIGYQEIEESFPNLDGKIHHYNTHKFIIPIVGEEPLLGGIAIDITDQKQAEQALRENEEKLLLLMNATAEGIYGIDLIGNCTYVNKSCIESLGYKTDKDLLGKNIHDLIHHSYPDKRPMNFEECKIFLALRQGKGTHIVDEVFWRADGTSFPVEYYSYPLFKNEQIVGAVVTFTDISERKHAEFKIQQQNNELTKLNADKDVFISILGHDLRSPFNNLLGTSEALIEDLRKLNIDEIENHINNINKTARSTFNLLEDLLKWGRVQQDRIQFKPQKLSFAEICMNILEVLKPNASAKNITLEYTETDHINVFADKDMLKTVLRNLVSNAIKFTNSGGAIYINAEQTDTNVTISVSDNGTGIPPDNLAKLFNISEVLTTKGTANEKGTGLGLLLCKGFIEKQGGRIWVESELGKGSTFYFTIPHNAEPNEINVVENIVSGDAEDNKIKNLKILITDDDDSSRMFLGITVKAFAKEILNAQNGIEAVVACKANPDIDLILMDIKMPEMDGFEATRQIRQINKKVIIIVQTAFANSNEKEKAEEAGCNDFISKPINKTLLKELIKKHFDN